MQPVPAGYPIAEVSGPYIIGCLLNWGLFGTLSVQLYLYYLAFPNDRRFLKYLVYGIYVIESVQTMFVARDAFAIFGYGFGDMDALTRMNFLWLTVPIMSAVAAAIGQLFYAYRIFVLSKSRLIPTFIVCVSLTSSVAATIAGIYCFQTRNITKLNNRKTYIVVGIGCGAGAVCDILIVICMTYYLMRSTTAAALLSFVLVIAYPQQAFFITPGLLVPKLYVNSIYMVLNSRFQIIGGRNTYKSSIDMNASTMMFRDISSQLAAEGARPTDGMQGPASVVIITDEIFNDNHEMGQDGCVTLPA
ncbi:hypothetical protein IW261DRAFT_1668927 [Armillaria novae-zelandiae]|uniref:Uncharacterized protein n=1 Tax=Armillaria novae-zelandiae TaxID=153914 RepID=A0AA39PIF2_9AGAR|nr:hypothetical protein IW261DRAFT_1668927 [Armillaria novae-zelandiae]